MNFFFPMSVALFFIIEMGFTGLLVRFPFIAVKFHGDDCWLLLIYADFEHIMHLGIFPLVLYSSIVSTFLLDINCKYYIAMYM